MIWHDWEISLFGEFNLNYAEYMQHVHIPWLFYNNNNNYISVYCELGRIKARCTENVCLLCHMPAASNWRHEHCWHPQQHQWLTTCALHAYFNPFWSAFTYVSHECPHFYSLFVSFSQWAGSSSHNVEYLISFCEFTQHYRKTDSLMIIACWYLHRHVCLHKTKCIVSVVVTCKKLQFETF